MRNKYFYPIFKLKTKSWIRYWLLKKTEFKGKLSDILTGFSFNLQNTLRQKFVKFEIEGHSEQETTEGYNLYYMNYNDHTYDFGGVTIISTKTGYKFSGTRTDAGTFTWVQRKMTLQPGTYTLKLKKASVCKIGLSKPNYAPVKLLAIGVTSGTFTLNEATDVCMTIGFPSAGTYNEENEIMIYSGTEDKPFEKYTNGASPNPSYEQPIKSAGENVNLCNGTSTHKYCASDGTIGLGNTSYLGLNDKIEVKPNTTYTITFFGYEDRTKRIYVCEWDSSNNWIGRTQVNSPTFTTGSSTKYIFIYMYNSTTPFDNISTDIKIEPGSIATPWSPYGMGSITEKITNGDNTEEQTYSIYTQQPMRSIGDVRDCFVKKSDGWYERHKIARKILDGTENWIYDGSRFVLAISDIFQYTDNIRHNSVLSNYYQPKTTGTTNIVFQYKTSILIYDTTFNSVQDFKADLAQKYANGTPVYVDYLLAEPLDLPCTQSQIDILENIPSTFAGQTNVFSIDEVKAYLKIQYWESDTNG